MKNKLKALVAGLIATFLTGCMSNTRGVHRVNDSYGDVKVHRSVTESEFKTANGTSTKTFDETVTKTDGAARLERDLAKIGGFVELERAENGTIIVNRNEVVDDLYGDGGPVLHGGTGGDTGVHPTLRDTGVHWTLR